MMSDLEAQETQLTHHSNRILQEQLKLREELTHMIQEARSLEESSILLVRDSHTHLYVALELTIARFLENIDTLEKDIASIHSDKVFNLISSSSSSSSLLDAYDNLDRLVECIELLRGSILRLNHGLTETCEVERQFIKNMTKLQGKYGYTNQQQQPSNQQSGSLISTLSTDFMTNITSQFSALVSEEIGCFDKSLFRLAWSHTIDNFIKLPIFFTSAVDTLMNELNRSLIPLVSRLQQIRESLIDKKLTVSKQEHAFRTLLQKLIQKQQKIQQTLIDRRQDYQKIITETTSSPDENSTKHAQSEIHDTDGRAISPTTTTSNGIVNRYKTYSISAAVGLESSVEKKTRLEGKISELEEAEIEVKLAIATSEEELETSIKESQSELLIVIDAAATSFTTEIEIVKSSISKILNHYHSGASEIKTINQQVLAFWKQVSPNDETELFYSTTFDNFRNQNTTVNGGESLSSAEESSGDIENRTLRSDIEPIESFKPNQSTIIDAERSKMIKNLNSSSSQPIISTNFSREQSPDRHSRSISTTLQDMVSMRKSITSSESPIGTNNSLDSKVVSKPKQGIKDSFVSQNQAVSPERFSSGTRSPERAGKELSGETLVDLNISSNNVSENKTRPGTLTSSTSAQIPIVKSSTTLTNSINIEEHELVRFGLLSSDKVLESFSCALYSKKGLGLTHGRYLNISVIYADVLIYLFLNLM
jgi:hypothetical protein